MEALSVVTACHLITKGAVGDVKARASARARQSDAARHAAIHAGRAGDRDGTLYRLAQFCMAGEAASGKW